MTSSDTSKPFSLGNLNSKGISGSNGAGFKIRQNDLVIHYGCKPIASLNHFRQDMLGTLDLVEKITTGSDDIVTVW